MAEPHLKKRVTEAVWAAGSVVEQGRRLEGRIVPRRAEGEQARLRRSVSEAASSLRSVAAQGRRVQAAAAGAEARYSDAARGFQRPARVFRTLSEARRHSLEEENALRRQILQKMPGARPDTVRPGDYTGPAEPRAAAPGSTERLAADVSSWIGRGVLGDALARRYAASPPVVTEDPHRFFRFEWSISGSGQPAGGLYLRGTNHIMMDAEAMADLPEAARRQFIAHEIFHYASYLGGGHTIRWRDGRGRPVLPGDADFLHEGCTELMSQQLTRSHGFDPERVGYGAETTVAFYLQQIAGANVLGAAYLGGDFTAVRRAVDARLGAGAFDSIMETGNGSGALYVIRERMQQRGMAAELARWDREPIVRTAGAAD